MRAVLEQFKEFRTNPKLFIESQFSEVNSLKNILYLTPKLNGRDFYRYILPSILLYEEEVCNTALTGIQRFNDSEIPFIHDVSISSYQIQWADSIVIPFTVQQLGGLNKDGSDSFYDLLRSINPDITIVYNVDFNFYDVPKNHPFYEQFQDEKLIKNIEDNIFYSDITLGTNAKLNQIIMTRMRALAGTRYKEELSHVEVGSAMLLTDKEIIYENITLELDEERAKRRKFLKRNNLRIGIIATDYNLEDIKSFKKQMNEIHKKHSKSNGVTFVVFGHDLKDDNKKSILGDDFKFEFVKPCSVIHYFKQLYELDLDTLFIPLKKTDYNESSENYNKMLEAGMFKIPVITTDVYPYNEMIDDAMNGYILSKKDDLIEKINNFVKDKSALEASGLGAYNLVSDVFTYHEDNIDMYANTFFKSTGTVNERDADD